MVNRQNYFSRSWPTILRRRSFTNEYGCISTSASGIRPPRGDAPKTLEEQLYAATLAINAGALKEAIGHLENARGQNPDHDQALYMLAVVQTQQGNLAEAVELLQRAVEINPENRSVARNDPDLDPLRSNSFVRSLLDPPYRTAERRRAGKSRATR